MTGTLSASLAFCLPSATGPNALVFAFKEIKVIDMVGLEYQPLSVSHHQITLRLFHNHSERSTHLTQTTFSIQILSILRYSDKRCSPTKQLQIRTGLAMNAISVLITVAATSSWVYRMLDLTEYPCWADPNDNITCNFTMSTPS